MTVTRRRFLETLGGLALSTLPARASSDAAVTPAPSDGCPTGAPHNRLFIPGERGFMGRLQPDDQTLTLRAAPVRPGELEGTGLTQTYAARHRGEDFFAPTLVLRPGQRVRIELENRIDEATIVHWHGLSVDTRNDGAGMRLAAPGGRYAYDFPVRNRGALYWYHPHPHGLTAGQAYRGMFGMLEITDDDEAKLRAALDLVPGRSEIPLLLQDRRGADYAASATDRMHGFHGDAVLINGTACPYLDVATRVYRFRVLNASNARTYRLGWRTAAGASVPFMLIGNDGGLLPSPRSCAEAFLASAERLDILLDLRDVAVGESIWLETRSFDPMHMEMAMPGMEMPGMAPDATGERSVPAMRPHGGSFPEGTARSLLQLRVSEKTGYSAKIPTQLSQPAPIDVTKASPRVLRLGFAKDRWRINDRVFASGETPIAVKRNTVETWLIRNYFNSMPHAMHLHGFSFEVLSRETSPDQISALKIDDAGRLATDLGRKDTVLVWPGESVKVAIDFSCPFPGQQTFLFHCHNLEHEDGGMMLGVRLS